MSTTTETDSSDGTVAPGFENRNVASGEAQVGQQVAFQIGDTTIHQDKRTYHVNQGDPPERRHEVACNLLAGGLARRAEKMFDGLLREGRATTERTYRYILAVLSERSLVDLTGELLDGIRDARKMCLSLPPDGWSDAVAVVWRLLCRVKVEYGGRGGGSRHEVTEALRELPIERQEEIVRHLDMILSGLAEEWGEADLKAHMTRERTVAERRQLSEKFFEAEPLRPKLHQPVPFTPTLKDWFRAVLGVVVLLAGLVLLVVGPFQAVLLVDVLLLGTGGYLAVRHGVTLAVAELALRADEGDLRSTDDVSSRAGAHLNTWFGKNTAALVDRLFAEEASGAGVPRQKEWEARSHAYRTRLKHRLVKTYQVERPKPACMRWLVKWHAKRAFEGCSFHDVESAPGGSRVRHRLGLSLLVLGLLGSAWTGDLWAALLLAVGCLLGGKHGTRIIVARNANGLALVEAEALHEAESAAYHAKVEQLRDRPTDAQIARWHALDRSYLVSDVIKRLGLRKNQIIEHVVLTECAPFARRGRVEYGPPRYSAYLVQIILLSRKGVRVVGMRLDAHTGEARNEERFMFQYDAVVSVKVSEKGVRTTSAEGPQDLDVENLRSRVFRLVLSSGEAFEMKVNSFKNSRQAEDEDEAELVDAAYETSGIENTLPVLESIAAEGESWIAREQDRREQWSRDWDEGSATG